MAECECFELTLLICELVRRPERNWRPLRHMGSRFTPLPFKDTSKPRWPLAHSLLCWPGRDTVVCHCCTHIHINTAKKLQKRIFYSLTCMNTPLSPPRAVVMRNSLLVHAWFPSASLELQLWLSIAHKEVVWRSYRTNSNKYTIQFLNDYLRVSSVLLDTIY